MQHLTPDRTAREIIAALVELIDRKFLMVVWCPDDLAVVERARAYLAAKRP